jgi:MoaA/NifB/PqqE/SkfB family radical SAM enzyme
LERADVPFGVSITVDTNNIGTICDDALIADLYGRGARIFYFIEYVAMDESTAHQELSLEGRRRLLAFIGRAKKAHTGIYIAFPGNEEAYGGCLSSGRGFVHINPSGGLEPCPAAPFTDINVTNTSLREALASPMLAAIREHHELLDESQGGCALWRNRHKVRALLDATTKYSCTGRE